MEADRQSRAAAINQLTDARCLAHYFRGSVLQLHIHGVDCGNCRQISGYDRQPSA